MLINDVAKQCNLTKKAVEYYVEQGLICPTILENGYRNFSKEDTELLKQISLYRGIGLSVLEIKSILADTSVLKNILYKKTIKLEQEKSKQKILQRLADGETLEDVKYEINNLENHSAIIERLLKVFPSYYGIFLSMNFSKYLVDTIKTEEQEEAYYEIIDFLDNVAEFKISEELKKYLDDYMSNIAIKDMQKIVSDKEKNIRNVDKFMQNNKDALKQYSEYKKSDEYKNSPANKLSELMKDFCSTSGYYDVFIPAMRKLSPSYNEYYEQLLKANEKFIETNPDYL
ncbi:MAG: MerR family transcriptional regulator [Lachnospiraceae bacterium]|jgi:DNA-binding transcriptional MerR regulator|nr:MerR family transcriptional regulator [Lachnospiraceae bacterium]